jgi:hypothetical protein
MKQTVPHELTHREQGLAQNDLQYNKWCEDAAEQTADDLPGCGPQNIFADNSNLDSGH